MIEDPDSGGPKSGSALLILTDLTEGEDGAAAKCFHEEHGGDVGGHLGGGHRGQTPEEVLKMTRPRGQTREYCVRVIEDQLSTGIKTCYIRHFG
jgi:hypothetical protein